MSAAFDKPELTASEVLARVYGFGMLEADIALAEVSVQDRDAIVVAYDKGDAIAIQAILDKPSVEAVEAPKKKKSKAE
jgi:hypothetical protein